MKKKRALITGINGMDGSHLADFLIKRGDYEVFGIERRKANYYSPNITHLLTFLLKKDSHYIITNKSKDKKSKTIFTTIYEKKSTNHRIKWNGWVSFS